MAPAFLFFKGVINNCRPRPRAQCQSENMPTLAWPSAPRTLALLWGGKASVDQGPGR